VTLPTPPARLHRLLAFLEHHPQNLALRKDAAREACDAGQWETARQLIDAGLQAHPGDAELLALSGFTLLQAQRYDAAEETLSAALALESNAPVVRYNLAFARFMRHHHAEALELLADPTMCQALPLTLLLRARCLHHLQRHEEAIEDCRAHLIVAPHDVQTHGLLALLLQEEHRSDEAQSHIEAALSQDPKQVEALLALACGQQDMQEYDSAQLSFDRLLHAHPQCGRGWLGRALVKLSCLQFAEARHDIERAAVYLPEHVGTWHVLAWAQLMLGDIDGAERAFDRAMVLDRNFGETHGGVAVIAALQGREDDARACIKRALRLAPQSMSAQYAQLLLLQRHGKHDEAKAVLEAFLSRPLAGSDMQFRDLIAAHVKHLQARTGTDVVSRVLH
jgi:tetratricopeptide (TPR) repeat protein